MPTRMALQFPTYSEAESGSFIPALDIDRLSGRRNILTEQSPAAQYVP